MEEIKAMDRIYKMLKQNFEPSQVKRILRWIENKFEEEFVKTTFVTNTGTNHTGVDQTVPSNFRTD